MKWNEQMHTTTRPLILLYWYIYWFIFFCCNTPLSLGFINNLLNIGNHALMFFGGNKISNIHNSTFIITVFVIKVFHFNRTLITKMKILPHGNIDVLLFMLQNTHLWVRTNKNSLDAFPFLGWLFLLVARRQPASKLSQNNNTPGWFLQSFRPQRPRLLFIILVSV